MSALWISHVKASDMDAFRRYGKLAGPVITAHGGVLVARGGRHLTLEGVDRPMHVVIRFPSLEAAEACYRDLAYQAALAEIATGVERDIIVVEELPNA